MKINNRKSVDWNRFRREDKDSEVGNPESFHFR